MVGSHKRNFGEAKYLSKEDNLSLFSVNFSPYLAIEQEMLKQSSIYKKTNKDSDTFTKNGTPIGVKNDRRKEVAAIGAAFLSSSLVVSVISGILLNKKHTAYKKILMSSGSAQEISLRSFQYEELEQATNGFKEEVGR
ncbi:hypothetical protein Scep_025455 [Stephania cephalantha]|uniref:Uncharacterized protein n=1 Tax=Stephania cephalantha TaxID=152367 RepID=A0AAP0EI93_9MAGN